MERSRLKSPAAQPRSPARTATRSSSNAFSLLNLQESLGNQGVLRLLASGRLRPKLTVNQPGDVYEQEADRVAQQVVSAPAPPVVQRSAVGPSGPVTAPPVVHDVLGSSGQPLDAAARAFFEPRFGRSFGDVRVHTDERAAKAARSVDALAFTAGRDVVFGAGQYAPKTLSGRRLIAHELTHVTQARSGAPAVAQRAPAPPKKLKAKRFAGNSTLNLVLNNLKTVKFNDIGEYVRLIQESLIAQGFPMPRAAADGIFKEETKATIEDYQKAVGVDVDGKVGPNTMAELDRRDPTAEENGDLDDSPEGVAKRRPPKVPLKQEGSLKEGEKGFEGGCAVHFKPVKFIGPVETAVGGKKGMTPFQVGKATGNPGRIKMSGRNKNGEPIGYQPKIQIQAPSAKVAGEFEVGFSQNVVTSDRRALYDNGGSVAKVIASLPVRDASDDADPLFIVKPSKEGLVESFQSENDARTLTWGDTPGTAFDARIQDECSGASNGLMRRFILRDTFIMLVVVRHKRTGCIMPLQNVRWGVDYSLDVSFDRQLNATFTNVQDKNFVRGQGTDVPAGYVQGGPRAGESFETVCT